MLDYIELRNGKRCPIGTTHMTKSRAIEWLDDCLDIEYDRIYHGGDPHVAQAMAVAIKALTEATQKRR